MLIDVSVFEWGSAGTSCGSDGCHATYWGFWRAGELIFQVDIVNLIALVAAVVSLLALEVYRRSSRRQRDLLLRARPLAQPRARRRTVAGSARECRVRMGRKVINGRRYFYKSEWVGGRVNSLTSEPESAGSLMAEMVAIERWERAADREQLREEQAEDDADETGRLGMVQSRPGRCRRGDDCGRISET